jgi:hypothetical protein
LVGGDVIEFLGGDTVRRAWVRHLELLALQVSYIVEQNASPDDSTVLAPIWWSL